MIKQFVLALTMSLAHLESSDEPNIQPHDELVTTLVDGSYILKCINGDYLFESYYMQVKAPLLRLTFHKTFVDGSTTQSDIEIDDNTNWDDLAHMWEDIADDVEITVTATPSERMNA